MSQQEPMQYRMLTVSQPWADFLTADASVTDRIREMNPDLAALPKTVENRSYSTTFRGPILIHSALRVDQIAMESYRLNPRRFVCGSVVGLVTLTDVVTDSTSPWAEPGRKHWVVTDPIRLLSPVDCPGFQGLRTPHPEVLQQVLAHLKRQHELTVIVQ